MQWIFSRLLKHLQRPGSQPTPKPLWPKQQKHRWAFRLLLFAWFVLGVFQNEAFPKILPTAPIFDTQTFPVIFFVYNGMFVYYGMGLNSWDRDHTTWCGKILSIENSFPLQSRFEINNQIPNINKSLFVYFLFHSAMHWFAVSVFRVQNKPCYPFIYISIRKVFWCRILFKLMARFLDYL